nr:hypothetical protein 22 [bacterium]
MAAFNADVLLDLITGPAERQVKKLETKIDRLERKAGDIDVKLDVDDQDIRRANRLLDSLERTRRVKLQVDERVNRSGGGGNSSSGGQIAGLLPAAASVGAVASLPRAFQAAEQKAGALVATVKEVESSFQDVVALAQRQIVLTQAAAEAEEKVKRALYDRERQLEKIAKKRTEINEKAAGRGGKRSVKQLEGDLDALEATLKRQGQAFSAASSEMITYARELKAVTAALDRAEQEQDQFNKAARGFQRPSTGGPGGGGGGRGGGRGGGSGASAAAAGGALGGLRGNVVAAIASLVGLNEAIQETRRIIDATLTRTQGEQRIRALSQGFNDYAAVLERSNAAAEKFNISQNQANAAFGQLFGRLRPLGLTLDEISDVYDGFNTAAILSGTTATEASGAMLQLSQALGAGALRGEEFNSVAEQIPAITRAIADQMGVPIGQLKALAKEGKITSAVVVEALAAIKRDGADRLANALDTPTQKVQKLTNRFEDLRVEIGKTTLPAFLGVVEGGTTIVENLTDDVNKLGKALAFLNRQLPDLDINLDGVFDRMTENFPIVGKYIRAFNFITDTLAAFEDRQRDIDAKSYDYTQGAGLDMALIRQMSKDAQNLSLLERLGLDDDTTTTTNTGTTTVDNLAERIRLSEQALMLARADLDVASQTDEVERLRIEAFRDILELQYQLTNALEGETSEIVRGNLEEENRLRILLRQKQLMLDIVDVRKDAYDDLAEQQRQLRAESQGGPIAQYITQLQEGLGNTQEMIVSLAQSVQGAIGNAIGTAVTSLVTGAQKIEQTLADMFQAIGKAFIDMAAEIIAKQLVMITLQAILKALGGASSFGSGASAPKIGTDTNYFSAFTPMDYFRAEGGPVSANRPYVVGERGPELFVPNSSGTVRSNETMNNYTPGQSTVLTAPPRFELETTVINGVEYATVDQVREMGRVATNQGAKMGEMRTMASLKNNRSSRSRIGI